MSRVDASRCHPKRWTVLTWLAVLVWIWSSWSVNIPVFTTYTIDDATGELSEPTTYQSLTEIPVPVGWPLRYVRPSYMNSDLAPVMAVGAVPPPAPPPSVHPSAMAVNAGLTLVAALSVIYVLQTVAPRFSTRFLLGAMSAIPLYFALGRLVTMLAGQRATWWYSLAVYFLPVPVAIVLKFVPHDFLRLPSIRAVIRHWNSSASEFENADDAIATATQLEMRGEWQASLEAFQRIAERWPAHADYVQRCIERIVEKQSLAGS